MKRLYLMRHGQTMFNLQKRIQGWCDSPLTQAGCDQARTAGRKLAERGVVFDHAYASTSERACDTLELVLEGMGAGEPGSTQPLLAYGRERGIKEMSYGELEAMPERLANNDPKACETYYLQFGGESSNTVRDRMVATLTNIMEREGHKTVLAVSHGGAAFNFLRAIQDPTEELKWGWGNCTTCIYTYEDGRFQLEEVIRPC